MQAYRKHSFKSLKCSIEIFIVMAKFINMQILTENSDLSNCQTEPHKALSS